MGADVNQSVWSLAQGGVSWHKSCAGTFTYFQNVGLNAMAAAETMSHGQEAAHQVEANHNLNIDAENNIRSKLFWLKSTN